MGLFDQMTVGTATSIDTMLGGLDSQLAYLDTFSANMEAAVAMGVDEGLHSQTDTISDRLGVGRSLAGDGAACGEDGHIGKASVDGGIELLSSKDGLG